MKKFIAIVFTILLIYSSCIVCYADDNTEITPLEYLLSYFSSFYYKDNIAVDVDKINAFWANNPDSLSHVIGLLDRTALGDASVIPEYKAIHDVMEANDGRYMVGQLHKDQLDGIHDAFNDYWSSDSAEIRSLDFSGFNITINGTPRILRFGNVIGSGTAARINSQDPSMAFVSSLPGNLDWDALYVFNGTIYYPPVLYTHSPFVIIQGSTLLPGGYYYVLSTTELMYVGGDNFGNTQSIDYWDFDGQVGIDRFVCNRSGFFDPVIYENGVAHTIGPDGDYSYDEMAQKYSMSIGLHINCPEMNGTDSYSLKDPPTDLPYDDDDNVIVMIPMDSIGEPIYMNPTTYNNYINNGNIYNTDDHSNNVVNNEDIENITNIYNNYVTNNNTTNNNTTNNYNFDDTNILNKLDIIIVKLDDIIDSINRFNPLSEQSTEPIYDNFSDCIFQNVPIADDIHDLIESMNPESSNSGFDNVSLASSNNNIVPSGASGSGLSGMDYNSTFSGLGIDMTWYAPYRTNVRELLKIFVYGFGLVAIWSSIKSVFGINTEGGSGGA